MTSYVLIGLGLLFLLICGLWLIVPALYGVPWIPTRERRIRKALKMARLQPDETLYDLGAGDGRVLIMAAREFDAKGVGIEIGPVQCALGFLRIWFSGSRHKIRMRCANFIRTDISEADVVYLYLTSSHTLRLRDKLMGELRSGTRVVTVAEDFPGWQPREIDRESLIFVYEIPPLSDPST